MEEARSRVRLFEKVNPSQVTPGAPPLVFYIPPTGYIQFKTPNEIKEWEDELRDRLGMPTLGHLGSSSESCSEGCSDDCD